MANRIVAGMVAGAAGTLALNFAGYLDMLVRGRPASHLPAQVAGKIADEIGLPLDFDLDADPDDDDDADDHAAKDSADEEGDALDQRVASRQEALGALLGYANGIGMGLAYGILRLVLPRPPTWIAGGALGTLAMAASDYPATKLGLTDPTTWSSKDWAADVVPHMAYGLVTVLAFEQIKK
jgi:hypothetical protein